MSLRTKPGSLILSSNAGISAEMKSQGYRVTLCFSVDPNASKEALAAIRGGICDIHITQEQYDQLRKTFLVQDQIKQDAARIDWCQTVGATITLSSDETYYIQWWKTDDELETLFGFSDWREAIDSAMEESEASR